MAIYTKVSALHAFADEGTLESALLTPSFVDVGAEPGVVAARENVSDVRFRGPRKGKRRARDVFLDFLEAKYLRELFDCIFTTG